MENQNFVITSLQSWDIEIGSTIKNTALEISKKNRVLYVNTPMDHATWLHRSDKKSYTHRMDVINKKVPCLRQINENMWVLDFPFMLYSVSKLPFTSLFDYFNRLNNKKIAKFLTKKIQELGFTDFIHLIDNDIYRSFYLKEYLKPKLSVYYRRDYVIGMSYWKKNGCRLEPLLCAKSDLVLANSLYFADELRAYNSKTYDIETGVNLELYDHSKEYTMPVDMKDIPRPVIGYVGMVYAMRLNCELLLEVAKARPQYSFVFTGGEDDYFKASALHTLPNVFFLGHKNVSELPAYISSYDVCINPQLVNDVTIGNYPLKIDEYLALGKPTVATKTHTMEHIFKDHVFLASNKEEYLDAIDKALTEVGDEKKREERIQFAQTHSWQHSVNKIYNIIESQK